MEKNYLSYPMRLNCLILLVSFLLISGFCTAQNITLSVQNIPLEKVLDAVKKQTKYTIVSNKALLSTANKVTINTVNEPLASFLNKVFKDQSLIYSIEDKTIILAPKPKKGASEGSKPKMQATEPNLLGQVINKKTLEPLSGVSIKLKGVKIAVSSNSKGEFYLSKVPESGIITLSYIGFDSLQINLGELARIGENTSASFKNFQVTKIAGNYNLSALLEPAVSYLDEVMVQAYGTTDRRTGTGNISRITSKELEKQPVLNPLMALVGRVPGMVVTQTNGYASSPVKIEIRGRKALGSNFVSDPMYIIDGVPLTNLELSEASDYNRGSTGVIQNGMSATGGQSPLFSLNPNDIESIEVLKDGDATAIYGSRAANGVILITTKKGKPGASTFTANVSGGISRVTKRWDMLNTEQYLALRREAFKNDNIIPTVQNAPDLMAWDQHKYTNWQDKLWGNVGKQTRVGMTLSGGDTQTQFRVSGNYDKQSEILTNSGSNQRGSLALNLGHNTLDRKFKVDVNAMYSYAAVNTIQTPGAINIAPNAPDIYDANGDLNYFGWNGGDVNSSVGFPFAALENPYYSDTHFITSNVRLRYEVLKNLAISTNFGYNFSLNSNRSYTTIAGQDPASNPTGMAFSGMTNNYNWIIEPQLDYGVKVLGGQLNVLLGTTLQKNSTKSSGMLGLNYDSDDFIESINLAPYKIPSENIGFYKYAAVFGRINYNWQDKYIININARRDGSSRFGPGKQFGNFGSVGAAWILSQESWIKDRLPAMISFVKLRGSYGLTGSDSVGDYKYLTQWAQTLNNTTPLLPYGGVQPLVSLLAVNPDYRWQVNKKLEGAVSLGFLEDRINLEVARYRERCSNQLTSFPTPIYTGFPTVIANWPANVENSGWEFSINAKLINTNKITWSLTFNGSRNTNTLLDYPDIEHSPYANYKIGKSVNTLYLLHYTGVDPLSGNYTFEDYNRDGAVVRNLSVSGGTGTDDRYIMLNPDPKFSGGFGSNFTYKNFSISCFFDYRNQIGTDPNYDLQFPIGNFYNQPAGILGNYWKGPGDHALFAKPTTLADGKNDAFNNSDGRYRDASFIRMSNLSLSYAFDEKLAKKLGGKSMNVNMNAQNIFVLSKAAGIDPELQQFGALPPAKIFSWGISLNF